MSVDDGLRPLFRARVPGPMHWQSVETGGTGRGIPDSNFCADGTEGWIEYKATDGWTVDLRPEQVGWLLTRTRHGGRTFVAVRRRCVGGPRRGPSCDELWLFPGRLARELKDGGLLPFNPDQPTRRPGLLLLERDGPSQWSWRAVRRVLLSTT